MSQNRIYMIEMIVDYVEVTMDNSGEYNPDLIKVVTDALFIGLQQKSTNQLQTIIDTMLD